MTLFSTPRAMKPGLYQKPAKQRRAPKISETAEHKTVADFFKIALGGNAVALHVRNERVGIKQRVDAVRMGILQGCPDFLIFDGRQAYGIELKPRGWKARRARSGRYTTHEERQLDVHMRLGRAGVPVEICEDLGEVIAVLKNWGVPLKAKEAQ